MPDIDPAALSRLDTSGASATPQLASKTLATAASAQKKPVQTAPRVDIEPLYTVLKTAIPDNWTVYKDAISNFVLGELTLDELSHAIDPFISNDASRIHMHNQLLCGIYTNLQREAAEQAVASWVSANDKPATIAKPLSGDAAEQRLKFEVMQMPPRVRHRIKSIQDEPYAPITHSLYLVKEAKWIHNPTAPSSHLSSGVSGAGSGAAAHSASSAGGASGTASSAAVGAGSGSGGSATSSGLNKELEIRKNYAQPLSSETRDLPSHTSLSDRLSPICYEEGLSSGPDTPETVADLLSIAVSAFVREAVTSIVGRSRADGPMSAPDGGSTEVFGVPSSSSANGTTNTANSTTTSSGPASSQAAATSNFASGAGLNGNPGSDANGSLALTNGISTSTADVVPTITNGTSSSAAGTAAGLVNGDATAGPPTTSASAAAAAAAARMGTSTVTTLGVTTSTYKKRLEREEAAAARGDVKRSDMGLLPVEVAALRQPRQARNMRGDLMLAWELDDPWLGGMMPWLGERARDLAAAWDPMYAVELAAAASSEKALADSGLARSRGRGGGGRGGIAGAGRGAAAVAGRAKAAGGREAAGSRAQPAGGPDAASVQDPDAMDIDTEDFPDGERAMIPGFEDAAMLDRDSAYAGYGFGNNANTWTWTGAARDDRLALGSLLDDCLAIGQ